ncbi:ParB/RepB/Spo0J family partition protein [Sediminivirga luteola]|uniref:ParB-like N-terminal domain-containing protein n=1 Tax=Sediminivirga luteola TaxID=1774748 RepID=A0A8J2TZH5_9MICO|nr:ParB/RepB/Spo0J family partition protein [Sediminivirga luteola]MCI2266620.1 ParB/RepB/Spo0J family partition protein [Sediminivirga luteola]GGA20244.1 hypothetical protein GCM10011333_24250 [Sediminivirga luteola]
MTEKKKGLGRGLGALIPNSVEAQRPVDVFFPAQEEGSSRSVESKDPAQSMRANVRNRKTQRKAAPTRSKAPGADATGGTAAKSADAGAGSSTSKTPARKGSRTASGTNRATGGRSGGSVAKKAAAPRAPKESSAEASVAVSRETTEVEGLLSVEGVYFGEIELSDIEPNPRQPRDVFDEDALDELAHSIREIGVLQPVVVRAVRETSPRYALIMGERRYRASKLAGKATIPAIVKQTQEEDLLRDALLENLHRVDLNPLEEAAAYQQLLNDFECTQEELSARIGRSRPQISNTLRLLKLPPLVQRRVAAGVLSSGHARALLGLQDASKTEVLAQRIVAEGLSVRATEEAVALLNRDDDAPERKRTQRVSNPELDALATKIGDKLDTRVSISMGKRKGKLSVEFASVDDLRRVLGELGLE